MKKTSDTVKTKILLAALPHVAFDGWTDKVLARAAKSVGIKDGDLHTSFPGGALDLVLYFSDWADAEMLKKISGKKFSGLRVRDRVAAGVQARLEILGPHRQAVAKSLSFLAFPPRNIHLPKLVWATADKIWRAAGDTATDHNHYTKRILLSGVLTATVLHWLNDESVGFEKTRVFLDRRIDDAMKLGKLAGQVSGKFRKRG